MTVILVDWTKLGDVAFEQSVIQMMLIITQYLNSGLSLQLVTVNLNQVGLPIAFLDGDYPDFTARWYNEIATFFVMPNILNVLVPFTEFLVFWVWQRLVMW